MSKDKITEDLEKIPMMEPEAILSTLDGIPLPPAIKKNLWKSLGRLITGLVDIPVAFLESKTESIKGETIALNIFRQKIIEKASDDFIEDTELMNRAVNYYGSKVLREQLNREKVFDKTIEDLKLNTPNEDTDKEIDDDWLVNFSRIVETKSNEDVQLALSKILSGEIKQPGSFGLKTLQTLAILDQETAKIFEKFCRLSYQNLSLPESPLLVHGPFKSPASNSLREFDLSYKEILELQDSGLVQNEIGVQINFSQAFFNLPFTLGKQVYKITPQYDSVKIEKQVNCTCFTKVGMELRRVMDYSFDAKFNEKFMEWVKEEFKIE
ncbi:hypothetical protein ASE21_09950 [Flavobacterium sp. Root901]|uniref:DUF2806 domain-containing protein n=1 Tax=Flavobacterium sp. Root901 TaxID=1736605 RepID=UPI0007096105|nr:DUF2806 domain-containing protein [Flavobacterium sp. Root901]KRD10036.1 hypothetical protein ASE21_09950 [Flavobacterium sp. Root901]